MKSEIQYNKKIADSFHKIEYYESNEFNIKNKEYLDKEKGRLRTNKQKRVNSIIDNKKENYMENSQVFNVLKGIYEKNKNYIVNNEDEAPNNSDLLNIVASVPILMISYAKVRKNPGSTTLAYHKKKSDFDSLETEQKELLMSTYEGADGISMEIFELTSKLIKQGKYPWGTSKRIYIEKPGKPGSKRPITIPPFMDRIIQDAIRIVLVAIYEPEFDKYNCSFGFRPNRSAHDAIYSLTNNLAQGLDRALEGDIKSAYDKVNRDKLIEILGKKIKDRKFLNFIKQRLDYEFYDYDSKKYVKENEGIPQGGTDSPYLWNIYMLEFDKFVLTEIKGKIEKINLKTRKNKSNKKRILNNQRVTLATKKSTMRKLLKWIRVTKKKDGSYLEKLIELTKKPYKDWDHPIFTEEGKRKDNKQNMKHAKTILEECGIKNEKNEEVIVRKLQENQRITSHRMNNMPFLNQNKKALRIIYTRYADDWIILTNAKDYMLIKIKEEIGNYLLNELHATLSQEKTLITNIKEKPAHFLGFEIKTYRSKKISKIINKNKSKETKTTAKTAGSRVFAGIDKQRLINRLHMKGYCDQDGFPREISKLSNLEAFTIIERINSVLIGLANYYANFIRRPKTELSRWIYIIRYSCFKTLAQKHKTTVRKILKMYKPETDENGLKTIEDKVVIEINKTEYIKRWKLHTPKYLLNASRSKERILNRKEIQNRFWKLHEGKLMEYEEIPKGNIPNVKHKDFLERIVWVNTRTKTSFDLPCCICGCEDNIEMHHVKHVRKTKYNKIKVENTWEQMMGLRNRRQIPVCRNCHMNIIHKGIYGGTTLKNLGIERLYDNRILNIESYVHKGKPDKDYSKTLKEKGWSILKDKEDK